MHTCRGDSNAAVLPRTTAGGPHSAWFALAYTRRAHYLSRLRHPGVGGRPPCPRRKSGPIYVVGGGGGGGGMLGGGDGGAEGAGGIPGDSGTGGDGSGRGTCPCGPHSLAKSTRPETPSTVTTARSRPPAPPMSTCQRARWSRWRLRVWSMTSPRARANCVAIATASAGGRTGGGGRGGGGGGAATTHAQRRSRRTTPFRIMVAVILGHLMTKFYSVQLFAFG